MLEHQSIEEKYFNNEYEEFIYGLGEYTKALKSLRNLNLELLKINEDTDKNPLFLCDINGLALNFAKFAKTFLKYFVDNQVTQATDYIDSHFLELPLEIRP